MKLECTPTTQRPRSPQPPTTDKHHGTLKEQLSAVQLSDEMTYTEAPLSSVRAPEYYWFSVVIFL